MRKRIGRWFLRRFGTRYNYDVGYLEKMLDVAPAAFSRFSLLQGVASYHRVASTEAYYAVKLIAAMSEDCGPCTQLVVEMASEAGVAADQIRAVLMGQQMAMSRATEFGFNFGRAMASRPEDLDRAREAVKSTWGEGAVIELSVCFAVGRVFPATKRGMGLGAACGVVTVLDQPIEVIRQAS